MSIHYSLQVDKKAKELEMAKLQNQKRSFLVKKYDIKIRIQGVNVDILKVQEQIDDAKIALGTINQKIANGDKYWLQKWEHG